MAHVVAVDELRALARAIALDEGLDVEVGPAGSGWFIDPSTALINIDGGDLVAQRADDLRGLICHEAAHAAVTRYLHLVPLELRKRPGMAALLNSLEDCRIEDWICARFPGARPWVELYNDRLFPPDAPALDSQPYFQQFCLGAIHEWWHGALPPGLADLPRQALEATAAARRRVIDAQPPANAALSFEAALAYDRSPVAALYRARDHYLAPDGFERLVRTSAYEAWRELWLGVRPVYDELVRADPHFARMKELEGSFLRLLRELRHGAPARGSGRRRGFALPPSLLAPGAPAPDAAGEPGDCEVAALPEALRDAISKVVDAEADNEYEAARRDVAPLADRTVDALERVLRPVSYPRWIDGYPSGSRVDLRKAMAMEADPAAYVELWQRKTLPVKRDPAFLLLLDLSGSMSGTPIHNCFRGTVLVAEVLERLQIPFAVYGFQDSLIPFKDFGTPLDPAARGRIGEMPLEVRGRRSGGHNHPEHNWDGPVLEAAARRFLAYPATPRVLLTVSDGEPSGPANADAALRRAVAWVYRETDIHLVGIGLGPGTDHVSRFYPDHLANVPMERFPEALGSCIDGILRVPLTRSGARR